METRGGLQINGVHENLLRFRKIIGFSLKWISWRFISREQLDQLLQDDQVEKIRSFKF